MRTATGQRPTRSRSYRDSFRLLLEFDNTSARASPRADSTWADIETPTSSPPSSTTLSTSATTPSAPATVRMAAIRSFFRYVSYREPALNNAALIQRVLAIPEEAREPADGGVLPVSAGAEVDALLAAPDRTGPGSAGAITPCSPPSSRQVSGCRS